MFIKVAVSAATFAIDKPYDYTVPEGLEKKALPGMRVFVPFGRGNRVSEGIVLSCSDRSDFEECKVIERTMDNIISNKTKINVIIRCSFIQLYIFE